LNELPKEVREAAGPGCACCLFWPPAEAARRRSIGTSEGLWQRVKGLPLIHYVDLAAKVPSIVKGKEEQLKSMPFSNPHGCFLRWQPGPLSSTERLKQSGVITQ